MHFIGHWKYLLKIGLFMSKIRGSKSPERDIGNQTSYPAPIGNYFI